jgi:septum site-determining protein MinC
MVQIKGIREGLLVSLGPQNTEAPESWTEAQQTLLAHIDQQIDFLRGGKLFLDVGNQVLHAVEMSRLRDAINDRGLILWGVLSNSPTTEQTAQLLGLATRLSRPSSKIVHRDSAAPDTALQGDQIQPAEEAMLVRRTLRSGFSLKYQGSITVIGDVNPGAEIIAGGSVVVWGRLRGVVHAGAGLRDQASGSLEEELGDPTATVSALEFAPTQLRIAGRIAMAPPQNNKKNTNQSNPETARLDQGKVIVEAWNAGKRQ